MTLHRKIGLGSIWLGVIMFFTGASMFSYRGDINPVISKIGMYSFLFWLPAILLGAIILSIGKRKRKKSLNRHLNTQYHEKV